MSKFEIRTQKPIAPCLAGLVVMLFFFSPSIAQENRLGHASTLKSYLTSDVIGVAFLDLEKSKFNEAVSAVSELGFDSHVVSEFGFEDVSNIFKQLDDAGVAKAYALLRMSDVSNGGPSWVFTLRKSKDIYAAVKKIQQITVEGFQPFAQCELGADCVLAAAKKQQLEDLKNNRPEEVRNLGVAWDAVGNGSVGLIVMGDVDSRKVMRQLMPNLPMPFDQVAGEMIADKIQWLCVGLQLDESLVAKLSIQAADQKSAEITVSAIKKGLAILKGMPNVEQSLPKSELDFVFESLAPTTDGNLVIVSTAKISENKVRLINIMKPTVEEARKEAAFRSRLNRLRNLAIASLNFESAYSHFPKQATVDENGESLLSWRVQILPFMEQNDLYEQFHHDEPWDSKHNLTLLKRMPKAFGDVSKINNEAGKTIFQMPINEKLLHKPGAEVTFGKITDGTSNTIFAVAVAEEHAVEWTKPDDWQVDFDDPTAKLKAKGREFVESSFCDGSTYKLWIGADKQLWNRVIQPDDGNIVDRRELTRKRK